MATPEDSNVLRQLIDQIDGELSTFDDGRAGSEQSLDSLEVSVGVSSHGPAGSRSGADNYLQDPGQQQQQRTIPPSATSAIFGPSFERQLQLPGTSTSLVLSGSYFMGPRAPQYIPSPLASPVSPDSFTPTDEASGQDEALGLSKRTQLRPSTSQASISAVAADLMKEEQQQQPGYSQGLSAVRGYIDTQVEGYSSQGLTSSDVLEGREQEVPGIQVGDDIKVDVTELYENFGQRKPDHKRQGNAMTEDRSDYKIEINEDVMLSEKTAAPLKLPELSFSNNDLIPLWTTGSGSVPDSVQGSEPRTDLQTYLGPPSNDTNGRESSIPSASTEQGTEAGGMQPVGPPSNRAFREQGSDRKKRLSLVTSGVGLVASTSRAQIERLHYEQRPGSELSSSARSLLDLPSWELAPLSPPVEVKETSNIPSGPTAAASTNSHHGSLSHKTQDPSHVEQLVSTNDIMSPASATLMTPTTPLTTREARILAGREALLKMSPERYRVQRGVFAPSTVSSVASSAGKHGYATLLESTREQDDGNDAAAARVPHERTRRASLKSQQSQQTHSSDGSTGEIVGVVPERGHLADVLPEKLVFPDQSLRPIPVKAYRVRKMTLKERNQTYAQACEEFTRARTGLDVWALRCMMQDRPALMTAAQSAAVMELVSEPESKTWASDFQWTSLEVSRADINPKQSTMTIANKQALALVHCSISKRV
ncbi:hypothetical protein BGX28_006152 [Mortierella sp. GBA30]|nr:hypothetical protein BGX28_006152 [Mortierella sp. GBA30]